MAVRGRFDRITVLWRRRALFPHAWSPPDAEVPVIAVRGGPGTLGSEATYNVFAGHVVLRRV
jgi:hypothetical protein